MTKRLHPLALGAVAACALTACGGSDGNDVPMNALPANVKAVRTISYNGASDDLLTAGLGKAGLQLTALPAYADPLRPTAAELRRAAIYNSYRAIVDMTDAGGYGTLYGPNVTAAGVVTPGDGKIAGTETLAILDDGSGRQNVTLMAQVPASFDPHNPCIITATSSGSRGVYGAISTGEWGLKRGCAVAYTDKGTGGAPHDLQNDTVPMADGTRKQAADTGGTFGTGPHLTDIVAFNAGLNAVELAAFNQATSNRFAFKHAHSGRNPEQNWGRHTLAAVRLALYAINQQFGELNDKGERTVRVTAANTLVIASSVSNGGGAAIAAAELDSEGLIDGVAVAEPAIEMPANAGVTVLRGGVPVPVTGRNLIDFTTQANLYQACASIAPSLAAAPYFGGYAALYNSAALPLAANRCAALQQAGLLTASTTAAQAGEAAQRLRDYGWESEAMVLHPSLTAFEVSPAVAVTFANALARARVSDNLCGFSYAAATAAGAVTPLAPALLSTMYATGNGVPPSAGVVLINNDSLLGPVRDFFSVSAAGQANWNLDGALCLRKLVTGSDAAAQRLQVGMRETQRNGNLRGKPALIVHGRDDALLPVNHTSRPYYALNQKVEGKASRLSYIEVTNAQHFDGFIGLPTVLPGYDSRYVPLHVYLNRALDAVYDNLKNGKPLPASQVVRTVPRGGTPGQAPAITAANVPAIAATPGAANAITMAANNTIVIPD